MKIQPTRALHWCWAVCLLFLGILDTFAQENFQESSQLRTQKKLHTLIASGEKGEFRQGEKQTMETGYIQTTKQEGRLTSLRFDATGTGHYGAETIASGGAIEGFDSIELKGKLLTLIPNGELFTWDLPFDRTGYYDYDLRLNYPSEKTTAGAYPLNLPFRKFVTSVGQTLFIEHFKRLPASGSSLHDSAGKSKAGHPYWLSINIAEGNQLLLRSEDRQNWDIKLSCPGQETIRYVIGEDYLRFQTEPTREPITIEVLPRGVEEMPGNTIRFPQVTFDPDFLVKFDETGKEVSASRMASDLMQMGIYWASGITGGGEWGLFAAETHHLNDPRSWHLKQIRRNLLENMGRIGYDRFDHFGMMFSWGRYPDYGAGALLNSPKNNASYDMRMPHVSAEWVQYVATYVLATGDTSVLHARRTRWVSTDGDEPQPICGGDAKGRDAVLSAGDVRLDRKKSKNIFTLGQTFTTHSSFSKVTILVGMQGSESLQGIIRLRREPNGAVLREEHFTLQPKQGDQELSLQLQNALPPGQYFVEVQDNKSLEGKYFGSTLYWITDYESTYEGGQSTTGPLLKDSVWDRVKVLFDYAYLYTGAKQTNLSYHPNDPEYHIPDHKSGRHEVGTQSSFWEAVGGGYDAFVGLWYILSCSTMAELAELMNEPDEIQRYRNLRKLADEAYNQKYWHTVEENKREFSRYFGCEDWDGQIHDYGFTYYNLEATSRDIAPPERARSILWWLDRGQWSPDEGETWNDHIYSIWEITPPFNSIANYTWLNLTGVLPYLHVLTNGGTRLDIAGRDITTRAKYLSIDNMHERFKRILGRYASPDRLTGGRTYNDPGGRGRWHFGKPDSPRADIEGYREIFPVNGVLTSHIPVAYLGREMLAQGLSLHPRIPSDLNSYRFEGIGYQGGSFDFEVEALRDEIPVEYLEEEDQWSYRFKTTSPFNKVGLQVRMTPFDYRRNAELSLTLEQKSADDWEEIAVNWYSHVQHGQWVWVTTEHWLQPEVEYRIKVHDVRTPAGEQLTLERSENNTPMIQCVAERTQLTIQIPFKPDSAQYALKDGKGILISSDPLIAVLEPGERALLIRQ